MISMSRAVEWPSGVPGAISHRAEEVLADLSIGDRLVRKADSGRRPEAIREIPGRMVDLHDEASRMNWMNEFCIALGTPSTTVDAGGKAANLQRVHGLGLRVPETRILTTAGLERFLLENGLKGRVIQHLKSAASFGDQDLQVRYADLCEEVRGAPLPTALDKELRFAIERLLSRSSVGLAIRSSAVSEDSCRASFAGIYTSHLGVLDVEEALKRVRDCWCSLWAPGALRYSSRFGLETTPSGMAVLLQRTAQADKSGVLYTADPTTGDPWRFQISVVDGLAVDLMSGSGAGTLLMVDWETCEVESVEAAPQQTEIRATSTGLQETRPSSGSTVSIPKELIQELVTVGARIDDHFSARMDIEWALAEDELWVVQARPLTALPSFFPVEQDALDDGKIWQPACLVPVRSDVPQGMLTPFYADLSDVELWFRYQPKDIVLTGQRREERDLNGFRFSSNDGPFQSYQDYFDNPGEYEGWLEANERRYRERWDQRRQEIRGIVDYASSALQDTSNASDLIPSVLSVRDSLWDLISFGWSAPQSLGWMCHELLEWFLQPLASDFRADDLLVAGDSYTLRMTAKLQELGRSICEKPVELALANRGLGEVIAHLQATVPQSRFLADLNALCFEFGKTPPSWAGRPAFWDFPGRTSQALLIQTIKNAWRGQVRDAQGHHETVLAERRRAEEALRREVSGKSPSLLARFDRILDWAQCWAQALNDRHEARSVWVWEKEMIWALGTRLQTEGLLQAPDQILLLRRADLETIASTGQPTKYRDLFAARHREWQRNRRLSPPERLGGAPSDDVPKAIPAPAPATTVETSKGNLRGRGLSGRKMRGRVRKVVDLFDPDLLDVLSSDDILVLQYTNAFPYADWHSLLVLVGGIVTPGRPSHHLMQVARECAVVMVGHIEGDLAQLPDGAQIEIDGRSGTVVLL